MEALELDTVLFVPAGNHPFKGDNTRTPLRFRLDMIELAIVGNPHFQLSLVDVNREGPHYSADTVAIIQDEYPDAELYFLMGGDNLRELPTWTRAEQLYRRARLAVMRRADEDISPEMHADTLPGLASQVDIIDSPLLGIWLSSTHVIERLSEDKSVRYLVPDNVLEYIRKNGIYAAEVNK